MAGYSIIKEDKENGELIIGTKVNLRYLDLDRVMYLFQ